MLHRPPSHSAAIGPGAVPCLALPTPAALEQRQQLGAAQAPSCGAEAFTVDPAALAGGQPRKHTQYPYVTGTSVLGITYKDGVLLASDTLGAYGSTKRYKSFERLRKVNDVCAVGASGELSDFQYIMRLLEELSDDDFCMDDGHHLKPHEVHSYLCRVLYNRRNKFDPLWNSIVVGGFYGGKPFLGTVGMIGTNYTDEHVATGFGNHLARPLMREKHRPDMSEEEATALMHECLKVCYYRDKNSINKFQLAKVTAEGVTISEPFALETDWNYKLFANPAANAPGTW
ncbi:20S proteasome beta type 4 [Chlorella sorokiniana]|uniref:Proteasome subunit beta n=1 Tax=Chlorella sorokiniana TaxID=3076 RepID=A0A2P6U3X6_CHLSO|nr:20S proteasome beta type 4 [Chlorella sorokiniana]|eukprot:PRW61006.1 20S proteasome beta type 4 [Chlorella sorokiniana]